MKKLIFCVMVLFLGNLIQPSFSWASGFWQVQSIDTMKTSRDASRISMSQDKIDGEVQRIAEVGATHVAIDTPYDSEFLSRLRIWVQAARKFKLNVWFRGNWSSWEGWFNYPKNLSRADHLALTKKFISDNPSLFENGDIFTGCPECESGGAGDPRNNRDVEGFRDFMLTEAIEEKKEFEKIDKKVQTNFSSMNWDVAKLVMNRETTQKMGGIVTIDHYVPGPTQSIEDAKKIQLISGGKIVYGEIGVPIPDINGQMTEEQQASWLESFLAQSANSPEIVGINYWVHIGGPSALWNSDGTSRMAVEVIKKYYSPSQISGKVITQWGEPISNSKLTFGERELISDDGNFEIPYLVGKKLNIKISNSDFETKTINIVNPEKEKNLEIVLKKNNPVTFDLIKIMYYRTFKFFQSLIF